MRWRRRRTGWVLLIALIALTSVGCGVRSESGAQRIPSEDVPFGLLDKNTTATAPVTTAITSRTIEIYLVRANRLVPVERDSVRPSVIGAFETLYKGPTPSEAANGVRTAIPPELAVPALRSSGPTVILDLEGPVADAAPSEQTLALAQMVYTATAFSGIEAVQFLLNGEAVEIPRADGTLTRGPVTRADYQGLG